MPTRPDQTDPQRAAQWATIRAHVGARIRAIRIEQGMTQEGLALASGVTRNVLIDVEHGRRSLLFERLFDIAAALNVRVPDLMATVPEGFRGAN